jgi:hypothetical protein
MRQKITAILKFIVLSAGLDSLEIFADPANPLPTGGTVTSGQATINQPNPNTLQITQTTNRWRLCGFFSSSNWQ